jgi:hypothetical protein
MAGMNYFSLVLCVCFVDRCLYFFFCPLCFLFFLDIRILIAPLVSSSSSYLNLEKDHVLHNIGFKVVPFFETDGYYCTTLNPIFPIRFLTSDIVFCICKT